MGLCRVGVDRGMESLSQAWHLPVFYWFSGIFHYFLIKKIQYITVKKNPRKSLKKGVNLSSKLKMHQGASRNPRASRALKWGLDPGQNGVALCARLGPRYALTRTSHQFPFIFTRSQYHAWFPCYEAAKILKIISGVHLSRSILSAY